MSLSTHILDTSRGRPAANVTVRLDVNTGDGWQTVKDGKTNEDGRLSGLDTARPGEYRLVFGTGDYLGPDAFYPEAAVAFRVADPAEQLYVPLLLSPFGYSTYRGS